LEEVEKGVLFDSWLHTVRAQERDGGVDYRNLACYPDKLTDYIQDHMSTALQGLEELYAELPSKVAKDDEQREAWITQRESFIIRTRAALDHLAAALSAVGCTDEELSGSTKGREESDGAPRTGTPSWVRVDIEGASLSPSDVTCVSGDVIEK
jgi:hypothetical protein